MKGHCYQVNMQTGWGGGEIYTVFFSRALLALGIPTTLYVNRRNPHWQGKLPAGVNVVTVQDPAGLKDVLQQVKAGWFVCHSPLAAADLAELRSPSRCLSCIAHMPLYGRNPERLAAHDYVIGVSGHVLDSLRAASISHYHPEALLGIADLTGRQADSASDELKQNSRYDWDLRKGRDRLLSWLFPLYSGFRAEKIYRKRPGITLGVVSRLTPIKQFPQLFGLLAPVLARHPAFNLEFFGAGGYASVRDLDIALRPIGARVRFWGHQSDVATVYRSIDYLMTGLPEKEALGLNVIEAQVCGTPVLAVGAKPFTETVADGISGLFYTDPRIDQGASFEALLSRLEKEAFSLDTARLAEHLKQFSEAAFAARVGRLCDTVRDLGFL